VAARLRELGVGPGDHVALLAQRSVEMIAGILGVLKAGGAYVPISPLYPVERALFVLEDCGAKVVLVAHADLPKKAGESVGAPVVDLVDLVGLAVAEDEAVTEDEAGVLFGQGEGESVEAPVSGCGEWRRTRQEDTAYCLYTSGSTGKPKGVMVSHGNLVNYCTNEPLLELLRGGREDVARVVSVSNFTFDIFVTESLLMLVNGVPFVLANEREAMEQGALATLVERHGRQGRVVLQTTPSKLRSLLMDADDRAYLARFETIILVGEIIPSDLPGLVWSTSNARLYNAYGPTEATVLVTIGEVLPAMELFPIGEALNNVQIYILRGTRPCSVGEPGELCIAGDCVAKGYLNRPELTERFFIPNPFGSGRLYRTGDLARWRTGGSIDILGRMDTQVKLRGNRIELGEVESALRALASVTDAAVAVTTATGGEDMLCAWFVATEELDVADVREGLAASLPPYMLPSAFMQLEALPLTPSGKLDRRALPVIEAAGGAQEGFVAPRAGLEALVAAVFEEALCYEPVGARDDFFLLGGHSLRAMQAVNRLKLERGIDLPLKTLFDHPTVEGLARCIEALESEALEAAGLESAVEVGATGAVGAGSEGIVTPLVPAPTQASYALSPAQRRLFAIDSTGEAGVAYNMAGAVRLSAVPDIERLDAAFRALVERNEVLRTRFVIEGGQPRQQIVERVDAALELRTVELLDEAAERALFEEFVRPFDLEAPPLVRLELVCEGAGVGVGTEGRGGAGAGADVGVGAGVGDEDGRSGRCLLFFDTHHIVSDAITQQLIVTELLALYHGESLETPALQFRDFSEWLAERDLRAQRDWWVERFADAPVSTSLPHDRTGVSGKNRCATVEYRMSGAQAEAVRALARAHDASEYMVLLSILMLLLARYCRQDDVCVGSPVFGRTHPDTRRMMGMFVNTLVMRGQPVANKDFATFLGEVKEFCLEAFEHQDYPFESLLDELALRRDPTRNPLFDVMFAFQNHDAFEVRVDGMPVEPVPMEAITAKFDLSMVVVPEGADYLLALEYREDLFWAGNIEYFAAHFATLVEAAAGASGIGSVEGAAEAFELGDAAAGASGIDAQQSVTLGELTEMPASEWAQVMEGFAWGVELQDSADEGEGVTAVAVFEQLAHEQPEVEALSFKGARLSYGALNARANQLAHRLRDLGVGAGDLVGLLTERSLEMVVAMIAVIKAGAAFIPIDTSYPLSRVQLVVEDSGVRAVLCAGVECEIAGAVVLDLFDEASYGRAEVDPVRMCGPADVVYGIYTSGTTGRPKAALIEHRNLCNARLHMRKMYEEAFTGEPFIGAKGQVPRIVSLNNYSFDAFILEAFLALLLGYTVVLATQEEATEQRLFAELVRRERIDAVMMTPSRLQMMMDSRAVLESLERLSCIVMGGEQLSEALFERLPTGLGAVIHNMYGPTEACIFASDALLSTPPVTIGRPTANTRVYLLDGTRPCGVGVPGELCIAGAGVGRGYLNRPELTAERFVEDPFVEDALGASVGRASARGALGAEGASVGARVAGRMYRTGDLARWTPWGDIDFMGRMDDQVKIRGFRIELGEVQSVLQELPDVKDAVVVVREDAAGDAVLCAYYTGFGDGFGDGAGEGVGVGVGVGDAQEAVSSATLRAALRERLPYYMVPAFITRLSKIPLDRNGKLDRRALPLVEAACDDEPRVEPRTEEEALIADAFAQALGIAQVGALDDFFELGGDSIKAIRVVSRVREAGFELAIRDLMSARTVERVAKVAKPGLLSTYKQEELVGAIPLTPVQKRFFRKAYECPSHYNQALFVKSSEPLEPRALRAALETLARHHDALRAVYRGAEQVFLSAKTSELLDFEASVLEGRPDCAWLEAEHTRLMREVDLEAGPLLRARLYHAADGDHLLLALHHLAVDGVSWRILTEDLTRVYAQVRSGVAVTLPAKTASCGDWARALEEYGCSERLRAQEEYWAEVAQACREIGAYEVRGYAAEYAGTVQLNEEDTQLLLFACGRAYNTQILDLLLGALGGAVREWTGTERVAVQLEGHGREELEPAVCVDRTVGWFTSAYPVVLDARGDEGQRIVGAKETLRRVPDNGLGYLVLVEGGRGELEVATPFCFNYLGHHNEISEFGEFELSGLPEGELMSRENRLDNAVTMNGSIVDGRLTIRVEWDRDVFTAEEIDRFCVLYEQALRAVIAHCVEADAPGQTAADFAASSLEQDEFLEILSMMGSLAGE
jgi:amino acid adenylation domain-containing protein/non-ribosomal peptide synthase protein (TIGR01720 family)